MTKSLCLNTLGCLGFSPDNVRVTHIVRPADLSIHEDVLNDYFLCVGYRSGKKPFEISGVLIPMELM